MKGLLYILTAVSWAVSSLAHPVQEKRVFAWMPTDLPRLVIYYQTTHDGNNQPISIIPLITEQNIALTHLIVCSFHINVDAEIHLNDFPPSDPHFSTLWEEARVVQAAGVKLMGMVGGAAAGSFSTDTLDSPDNDVFERYYGQLRDVIKQYKLEGMDLDVEQSMSQGGIKRLVERLYADFGANFEITLAPVASALQGGSNLSGFDYKTLESEAGDKISFLNAQFYNGFGSTDSRGDFDKAVENGFPASKVVLGQITTPANGFGFVPFDVLGGVVKSLQETYGQIGGIMGWEYFNSEPGSNARPWEWAQKMTAILRPDAQVPIRISKEIADKLSAAWDRSLASNGTVVHARAAQAAKPNYHSWINV